MVKVAVAGGAGKIGLHIVEAIHASKTHTVVVLSRESSPPNPTLAALGIDVVPVDYTSHTSLVRALTGVHTVISTILSFDPSTMVNAQLALLAAAIEAGATRFAPSEWALRALPDDPVLFFALKNQVVEALRGTRLEWTLFECGLFMNYLASGTPGIGYLTPLKLQLDLENCTATVPGDGNTLQVLTRAEDVGAFVAASLDLEKWPEESGMSGDIITTNDLIKIAEGVRGKKFDVTYIPIEEVRAAYEKTKDSLMGFREQNALVFAEGKRSAAFDSNLNRLCPSIQPMGAKEFMEKWWLA